MAKHVDEFHMDEKPTSKLASHTLKNKEKSYGDEFEGKIDLGPSSTQELVEALRHNESIDIESRALFYSPHYEKLYQKNLNKEEFLREWDAPKNIRGIRLRESDSFLADSSTLDSTLVGQESIALLGGPFYRNQYLQDFLRQHQLSYYAYTYDPIAHAAVEMVRDFTLGRGFRVDCKNPAALALWRAFEKVNDIQDLMDYAIRELTIFGEIFLYWLPNQETKIAYKVGSNQAPPRGILPRVRLLDPSVVWEKVTYPEDITRVLFYQVTFPTQWQLYGGTDKGQNVPITKYINEQIPADQMDHFAINKTSMEKRGRSELYSVLGYLKRLRDSVNYSIISLQKNAAWSIDTTLMGSQTDIDAYIEAQQALGTIAPAGSEFVHTDKIKREYLANQGGGKGNSNAFDWAFSMVCAGLGIPVSYFGTHLSGGTTKASALVATEPVAKKWQMRQIMLERIVKKMASRLFEQFGLPDEEVVVTFPEIIVQDRSSKLKDLMLSEQAEWISKERAATIAAKELEISDYDYQTEKEEIESQGSIMSPLSMPGASVVPSSNPSGEPEAPKALSSEDRADYARNNRL